MNATGRMSRIMVGFRVVVVAYLGVLWSGLVVAGVPDREGQRKGWPLAEAYALLFKGLYDEAAAEAQKAVVAHENDHIIVSRGLDVQTTALILAGRKAQAIECSSLAVTRYEKDNSPYSDTYPVPMSLFMKIQRAKAQVFLHQRVGEYQQAAEAIGGRIAEEKRALAYLQGEEQSRRGQEFLIEACLRSTEGDLYRYAGQYAQAVARYAAALQFLAEYKGQSRDVVDGNAPRGSAFPTDKYLRNLLPRLIEQCKSSGSAAQYARNVAFAKEIGDWHRNMGSTYNSKPDHAVALRRYKEALAYLQRKGLSPELDEADRKRYSALRDDTLPWLISGEEAALK